MPNNSRSENALQTASSCGHQIKAIRGVRVIINKPKINLINGMAMLPLSTPSISCCWSWSRGGKAKGVFQFHQMKSAINSQRVKWMSHKMSAPENRDGLIIQANESSIPFVTISIISALPSQTLRKSWSPQWNDLLETTFWDPLAECFARLSELLFTIKFFCWAGSWLPHQSPDGWKRNDGPCTDQYHYIWSNPFPKSE